MILTAHKFARITTGGIGIKKKVLALVAPNEKYLQSGWRKRLIGSDIPQANYNAALAFLGNPKQPELKIEDALDKFNHSITTDDGIPPWEGEDRMPKRSKQPVVAVTPRKTPKAIKTTSIPEPFKTNSSRLREAEEVIQILLDEVNDLKLRLLKLEA